MKEIGEKEQRGVIDADTVIVLLPGCKGTHVELGLALGHGKRIFLYSSDGRFNNPEETSTFYHLSEVTKCHGTLEELLTEVIS